MTNLNREIKKIKGDVSKGLLAAAYYIKGEAMEVTPHDTGNLINTAFAKMGGEFAYVGYTASYALYVHEMPSSYNYKKSGTSSKYLEKPIIKAVASGVLLDIIQKRAVIK